MFLNPEGHGRRTFSELIWRNFVKSSLNFWKIWRNFWFHICGTDFLLLPFYIHRSPQSQLWNVGFFFLCWSFTTTNSNCSTKVDGKTTEKNLRQQLSHLIVRSEGNGVWPQSLQSAVWTLQKTTQQLYSWILQVVGVQIQLSQMGGVGIQSRG